ncbi:MAG: flagellar filament capping protein FliD [Acidobacteriia bacterium]|nr:flagellar filament capping protein FliD [Terriglobia bacterium]
MVSSVSSLVTGLGTNSGLTNTNASTGTSTGLGQGIDVASFVQLAEAGQQIQITSLQTQQAAIGKELSTLSPIASDLTALQSTVSALNDPLGVFSSEIATSSNPNALSATAASSAVPGAHTISVTSLATTSSYYSDAVATSSTALATGDTFTISAGLTQVASVTVDSTNNTLTQIAAAINNQTTAVQASVVQDANGARLAIVSTASGAPGDLAVTGSLHQIDATAINFHQAVAGLNAVLTVDGVPISSATNTVSNVINGVTLNLTASTGSTPVTLTVAPDTSSISTAINNFVSAYNTAITAINVQFQVSSGGSAQPLQADGSLRDAQQALLSAITYSVTGSGGPVNLTSLGINVNNDGTLSVDSGALATALSSNFSGVQSFLQTASTGFASNLTSVLKNLNDPTTGELTLDAQGYAASSTDLTNHISDLQAALAVQTQNLIAVYARVNTTLQELPLLQQQLGQQLASIP